MLDSITCQSYLVTSQWSQWTACSKSCNFGVRSRARSCKYGKLPFCQEETDCNKLKCPSKKIYLSFRFYIFLLKNLNDKHKI